MYKTSPGGGERREGVEWEKRGRKGKQWGGERKARKMSCAERGARHEQIN
jgi:hypothetical protein